MKELRIGLVLYGGVSLAVYMNGIVTELWHLLRASRARDEGTVADLDGNALIYADLLDAIQSRTGQDLRVVVDAVAGTSAGGVNGAVLAKAVVDGGDASVLNRVWIEDADIAKLRDEPARRLPWAGRAALTVLAGLWPKVRGVLDKVDALPGLSWTWLRDHLYSMIAARDGTQTVLDGGYFTRMIASTFTDMARRGDGKPLLPKRASFDLFLTRTDLHGWPRHLPVSPAFHPEPLYERTHAHVMQFRRGPNGGRLDDDFGLTYAARSTAGFPVAFAPIAYDEIAAEYRSARPGERVPTLEEFARRHLAEHRLFEFPVEHAWMVDGGVLDNKPFSHVTGAIERKPADREVYRAVVYVEPDPETEIDHAPVAIPKPLEVGKGLYGLFRHEPIYEDLRRLQDRNTRVREIRAILDADAANAERAAEEAGKAATPPLDWPPAGDAIFAWRGATNDHAAREALSGYPGYVVLKARSAARVVAALICHALGYPYHSRQAYFTRALVSEWLEGAHALDPPRFDRERGYVLNEAQATLLSAFDVPFRLRRLRALVQAANASFAPGPDDEPPVAREALGAFKAALADAAFAFDAAMEDDTALRAVIFGVLGEAVLAAAIDAEIAANAFDTTRFLASHEDAIAAIYGALNERFRHLGETQNEAVAHAVAHAASAGATRIAKAFATFPFTDLIAFPLMRSAGVGDLFEVRAMRISPHDVPELAAGRPPLKSAEIGAFKGFLDRAAREHDLVWGRLDGAHRLVQLILAAANADLTDPEVAQARAEQLNRLDTAIRRAIVPTE